MRETGNVSVLVVDDQQLIREGIASMLNLHEGISVVDSAENGHQAIEKAGILKPNVILMDIQMPEIDGISAAEKILESMPNIKIIMLTTFDDEEYIIRSLRIGASGYLLKDIPADDLAQAVQLAHAGVYQLDPKGNRSAEPPGNRRNKSGDRRETVCQRGHSKKPRLKHSLSIRVTRSYKSGCLCHRAWAVG